MPFRSDKPLSDIADLPVVQRAGGPLRDIEGRPLTPYAPEVLDFLGALSHSLLAAPGTKLHPDIVSFAYWCRPANLRRLAAGSSSVPRRLGRGLAFHVAPANVPVNFAYSLAFGMLAGCANIVRVPESFPAQSELVCAAISRLFADPVHARIAAMNRLIQYPRNDEISAALSARCQARVLWGGDQTIAHLRSMAVPPRCVEVAFADRYSLCLLDADAVRDADPVALASLAAGFYNDAYLLDQNACSSPHLVLWRGSPAATAAAQTRFWPAVAAVVRDKYVLAAVQAVDKFTDLCRLAIDLPAARAIRHGNGIYRLVLDELPENLEGLRGRNGLFFEYRADDQSVLRSIIGDKFQTLTTFGIERDVLVEDIVHMGLPGIDRVVAVGSALDIGVLWDGYDIVASLSRIIGTQ